MGLLFGTDGIRGTANQYPMTAEMALRVGRAAATVLAKGVERGGPVVIGQDTRLSGDMLAHAVAAGVLSAGTAAARVEVVPTPAVARLVIETGASFGIMISASHNPFEDNGIKLFDAAGMKLGDVVEAEIERRVLADDPPPSKTVVAPAGLSTLGSDPLKTYRRFLVTAGAAAGRLDGLELVLDCANGATSRVAPQVFGDLGARVTVTADQPDGRNINAGCGSEHPQTVVREVLATGARAGLAFDGDGDRVLAVDETGRVLTGDQIIAICAGYLDETKQLCPRRVVTTVMSNLGLGLALRRMGIDHHTSAVGDRRVMETMCAVDAMLGGEDSGHIIFRDLHTTGDGILSGLRLLSVMVQTGRPLSELARVMTVFPQVLMAVAVREKPPIEQLPGVTREIEAVQSELAGQGRVLVRYSGTQPVCRVMVEGPTAQQTDALCRRIADVVRRTIG